MVLEALLLLLKIVVQLKIKTTALIARIGEEEPLRAWTYCSPY
jgi:hypothetical protein